MLWGHSMIPSTESPASRHSLRAASPGFDVGAGAEWTGFAPRGMGLRDDCFHIKEVDTVSLLTPAPLKQFIAENHLKTAQDVQEALKAVFAETLQAMDRGRTEHPPGLREVCD